MLIKLGIIASVLILGGMMFSTEITSLFPNTSALLADSLKDDINSINAKVTDSAENRLDSSIDKTIQSVSDSVYEGITDTGDKLVENVNEKISEGITDTGDTIKNEILESSTSSTEILVNEVSGFNPLNFFKDLFKIN
ncbi:MAG: hypothetical protein ACE5Q8_04395 [Nitrosopumilus sp.]